MQGRLHGMISGRVALLFILVSLCILFLCINQDKSHVEANDFMVVRSKVHHQVTLPRLTLTSITPLELGFIHVPKCGGTSIWSILSDIARKEGKIVETTQSKSLKGLQVIGALHHSFMEIQRAWETDDPSLAPGSRPVSRIFVTVLRHPVTRIASHYEHILRHCGHHPACPDASNRTLESFAKLYADGYLVKFFNIRKSFGSENSFCCMTKTDLEDAKYNLLHKFHVVGVMEDMDKMMKILSCRVPWVNGGAIPHLNRNSNKVLHTSFQTSDIKSDEVNVDMDLELYEHAKKIMEHDYQLCSEST